MARKVSFLTNLYKPVVLYRAAGFAVALLLLATPFNLKADTAPTSDTTPPSKKTSNDNKSKDSTASQNTSETQQEAIEDEVETEKAVELTHDIAEGKDKPTPPSPKQASKEVEDIQSSLSSENELFDSEAANKAMETVAPEVYPNGIPKVSSSDSFSYVTPKHGISKLWDETSTLLEDKDALGIHSKKITDAKQGTQKAVEDGGGVGFQNSAPHIAFQSSNGSVEAPSLGGDLTPAAQATTDSKQSEPQTKTTDTPEAVPDIFSTNKPSAKGKKNAISWLDDTDGTNAEQDTKNNAWLSSLVPPGAQEYTDTNNSVNTVEWGSYETAGNAPSIALEAPVKPGEKPLPLYRPESLFSDPFGVNSWLRKRGIAFTLDNQNEFAASLTEATPGYTQGYTGTDPTLMKRSHPLKEGGANAGQVGFQTDVDWETLAGIKGFETHTLIVGRYGIPGSRSFGENLNNSSEIYGGGGNVVTHLAYAYGEESILNNRLRIAAGRMPLLTFFAKNPLECTFMNNAFCGSLKTSSDNYTRVSSPNANWGAKVLYYPTANTYIQAGVFFDEDWNTNRSGFKFTGSRIHGQSIPVELGWNPVWGDYKGHYKIGAVPDTAPHGQEYKFSSGNQMAFPGFQPKKGRGEWGAWVMADQVVLPHKTPANLTAGLVLLGGFWYNEAKYSTRHMEFDAGLIDTGFWKARPLDSIGINFAWTDMSNWVRKYERGQEAANPEYAQYCALKDGQGNFACGVQTTSEVLEVLYKIHIRKGIYFSPDFQYFFHPGGQHNLKNTAMFGFKSHVQIF